MHLRYAVRTLYNRPAFTIPAILALALGIGATATIFSVVDCVLLRPLPYPESDRLVSVGVLSPDGAEMLPSTEFLNWSRVTRTLEGFAAQGAGGPGSLMAPDGATPVVFQKVTAPFLATLRVHPAVGRDFLPSDGALGAPNVTIVSDTFWRTQMHHDPAAVGKSVNIDGVLYQVIGVLPASFRYMPRLDSLDVLLPLQIGPSFYTDRAQMRGWHAIGRLKAGVTVQQARAEFGSLLAGAIRDTAHSMPRLYSGAKLRLLPYLDFISGRARSALLLLLGGVGCLLAIACANVANLLLARGAGRRRELAVRAALGASRVRLVRQLLTESLVLAVAGGVAGSAIAFAAIPGIRAAMAHKLPRIADLTVDLPMLAFALLLTLGTGLVFGLPPALRASRWALSESMKRSSGRAGMWLAAAELALSLSLLVSAGLLMQSLWRAQHRHLGFDAEHLLVADLNLKGTSVSKAPQAVLEERLARIPGAVSWTITDGLPPDGGCCGVTFARPGRPSLPAAARGDLIAVRDVTPAYFSTLHITLQSGRFFDAHDTNVMVINESLARRFFPGEDPIGQAMMPKQPHTIVGVIADTKNDGLSSAPVPEAILPFQGSAASVHVALRSTGDPTLVAGALREQLHELDPLIAANIHTMEEQFQTQTAQPRFLSGLFAIFAFSALALGMVGIYGVMAFTVASRTREFGIRMALGADRARVVRLVLRDAAGPVCAGIVLGLAGCAAAARSLQSLLYDIRATDPTTYVFVALLLAAVAFAASLAPARRAGQVDPAVVLRAE